MVSVRACIADPGDTGTDFVGFGRADGGVAGEGFPPVVPGLNRVAVSMAGAGETGVRAGLLPRRAGFACEPERGGVVRTSLIGITCQEQDITEAVERAGLYIPAADLARDGQGLLKVPGSLLAAAEPHVSFAKPDQDLAFAGCVA